MSQALYDLPVGWEWVKLENIFDTKGFSVGKIPKTEFGNEGSIPIIDQSQNFIAGYTETDDFYVGMLPVVVYGDHTNNLKYVDFKFICGADGTKVLVPKKTVSARYSYYLLERFKPETQGYRRHFPILKTVKFPLPPLAEQTRIVEKLDAVLSRIDTAIDELQQSLALVDAMFDSYLSSLSYETVKLGDLVNITTGRLDANAATDDGEFSFFTCSRETYRIDNYAFDCEAILLAGNNAVGDFNVKHFKGKFNAYQRTYVITVKDNNTLLYRFLYFQLVDSMLRFKNKSIGSGTKFLKIGMIKDLDILLPNLAEQQQVVEALDALNEQTTQLKTELTAKIGMFNQLKASVLDGAFRGEL